MCRDGSITGRTESGILEAVREFSLFDGARETVHELKRRGYMLGVISGTLNVVLDTLFPDHPFDEVYTNKIFFDGGGRLDGWEATRYDSHGKPEALRDMARRHGVDLSRTAFVGDGENDEPLLGVAGYFAAFRPRSRVLCRRGRYRARGVRAPETARRFRITIAGENHERRTSGPRRRGMTRSEVERALASMRSILTADDELAPERSLPRDPSRGSRRSRATISTFSISR